jgi:hypothetical protein
MHCNPGHARCYRLEGTDLGRILHTQPLETTDALVHSSSLALEYVAGSPKLQFKLGTLCLELKSAIASQYGERKEKCEQRRVSQRRTPH